MPHNLCPHPLLCCALPRRRKSGRRAGGSAGRRRGSGRQRCRYSFGRRWHALALARPAGVCGVDNAGPALSTCTGPDCLCRVAWLGFAARGRMRPRVAEMALARAAAAGLRGVLHGAGAARRRAGVRGGAGGRQGCSLEGSRGVPPDPFAPRRGPLGPSADRESAIGNAPALVHGPLA